MNCAEEIDMLMNAWRKTMAFMADLDRGGANFEAKMSCICMLFDHICERHKKDKERALLMFIDSVKAVNREFGDMYEKRPKNADRYGMMRPAAED